MKLDRQLRGERLPTVPETASLLGKAGGDATSPRTFAARRPQRTRPLLTYVAICMTLGLAALYFLGVLPVGRSSGAWIRSLPKTRHNPAAVVPDMPQPTNAQLDAAASRLDRGDLPSDDQLGAVGLPVGNRLDSGSGKDSGQPDSGDAGSKGSSNATPGGDGGVSGRSAGGADVADKPARPRADAKPQPAADREAAAPKSAAAPTGDEGKLQAAEKHAGDQPGAGGPAAQPIPAELAKSGKVSDTAAQDGSSGSDSTAAGSSGKGKASSKQSSSGASSGKAAGPLATADSNATMGAASEQNVSSSGAAPSASKAEAALSPAAAPSIDSQSDTAGGRSGSDGRDSDGGSLSRASAPDEAALLADPEAKEAQPDSQPGSAADGSDSSSAASRNDALAPDAAGSGDAADGDAAVDPAPAPSHQILAGGGSGGNSSDTGAASKGTAATQLDSLAPGEADSRDSGSNDVEGSAQPLGKGANTGGIGHAAGPSAASTKPEVSSTAPSPGSVAKLSSSSKNGTGGSKKGSAGKGSSGSKKRSGSSGKKGSKGSSGASDSGASSKGNSTTSAKGQGSKMPAGRKVAAGQRGSSGSMQATPAMQAGAQGQGAASEQGCLAFAPAGCHLIPGKKEPLQYPKCDHPPGHIIPGGPDCSFDLEQELRPCPIIGGGLYFEHEKPQPACNVPPFWQERSLNSPSCVSDGVCCSGDGINGTWHSIKAAQAYGAQEFVLDESMGCHYHQYTRRQVLSCLANTTVILWGDSMVRQLFNRIPALFRGHRRAFDAQTWRAERFEVCEAADLRVHAPVLDGLAPKDGEYHQWGLANLTDVPHPFLSLDQVPESELLDMLDPHASPKAFPGETCGKTRPVSFQYIPATALSAQYRFGGYYLKTHKDISQSIWVLQVGYWDMESREADEKWLKTMNEALERGIQRLVIVTAPTAFVGIDERDPRRWILRDRNDWFRRWAVNDTTGRTLILDMDTLSMAPGAPSGLLGNWTDWHYSCKFSWVDEHEGRHLKAEEWALHSQTWLDPSGWTLGGLQPNMRRDCIDDMNLTVLQILFNMLCNKHE